MTQTNTKTAYHATPRKFKAFSRRHRRETSGHEWSDLGFWFCESLEKAKKQPQSWSIDDQLKGHRIIQASLSIERPFILDFENILQCEKQAQVTAHILTGKKMEPEICQAWLETFGFAEVLEMLGCICSNYGRRMLIHYGYDGAIYKSDGEGTSYIALHPYQIKQTNLIETF